MQRFLFHMALTFMLCTSFVSRVFADVTVIQALTFGSFIVKNNDAQYDITVTPGGVYNFSSAGFVEILPPQPGIFDIDGLPANSVISSIVITQIAPLTASGEGFQMLDFQENHTNTNPSGVARVNVGATARTSGNGNPYLDDTFLGELQIQINF